MEGGDQLDGVTIINPETSDKLQDYADTYYEMRKAKGMTPEQALESMKNPLFFGTMLIKKGEADGMVAGAINSTGNTLRPALQIIRTAPGMSTVSSCFIMDIPNKDYGDNGIMIFGDCAVIPNPSAEQLAAIAISSAQTGEALCGIQPRVAMLSFSTKGSAKHEFVAGARASDRRRAAGRRRAGRIRWPAQEPWKQGSRPRQCTGLPGPSGGQHRL